MKKIFVLFSILLLVFTFFGCNLMDSLFYKTDSVEPKELSDYTGTPPADKETTMEVVGVAAGEAIVSGLQGIMSNDQWNNFSKTLGNNYPALKVLGAKFLSSSVSTASKSISFDGDRDGDDGKVDFTISIKDESVNGQESGTITVNNLDLKLKAEVDDPDTPTKGSWDFDTSTTISLKNYADTSSYTINSGKINLKAKGNGNLTFDSQENLDTIKYYVAIDLKAGFSISGGTGKSGKFIIEFNYVDNNSLTQDDLQDTDKLLENMALTINVKVYDNNNTLVHEYKYTQDDLKDELENLGSDT